MLFPLDQTPTPSKFLRAFEEAGLDEVLNPFDATFAKAANDRVRNYCLYLDSNIRNYTILTSNDG